MNGRPLRCAVNEQSIVYSTTVTYSIPLYTFDCFKACPVDFVDSIVDSCERRSSRVVERSFNDGLYTTFGVHCTRRLTPAFGSLSLLPLVVSASIQSLFAD
uniref:Uncharacterized protein n=1 Tax=Ascaris lumbricoides TaxID=6252 RepID=A0A9J2PJ92_ASCLU